MIHDLTANNDFHNNSFGLLGRWRDIFDRTNRDDELTPPDNEIVLTGSGFDREHKRYILDYESDTITFYSEHPFTLDGDIKHIEYREIIQYLYMGIIVIEIIEIIELCIKRI